MDVVLLVVSAIAAVGALAAAVFAFPQWLERIRRPKLRVSAHASGSVTSAERIIKANLDVQLDNGGKGSARHWRFELAEIGPGRGKVRLLDPRSPPPGQGIYQMVGGGHIVEVRAVDASDVIPPGQPRRLGTFPVELPADDDFVGRYAVTAAGMKKAAGELRLGGNAEVSIS